MPERLTSQLPPVLLLQVAATVSWEQGGANIGASQIEIYARPGRHEAVCVIGNGSWNSRSGSAGDRDLRPLCETVHRSLLMLSVPDASVRFLSARTVLQEKHESPRYLWLSFQDDLEFRGVRYAYAPHAQIEPLIGQSVWREHRPGRP